MNIPGRGKIETQPKDSYYSIQNNNTKLHPKINEHSFKS